jgi:hypothetical protein
VLSVAPHTGLQSQYDADTGQRNASRQLHDYRHGRFGQ